MTNTVNEITTGSIISHSEGMTKREALNLMNSPAVVSVKKMEKPFTVTAYIQYMDIDNATGELRPIMAMQTQSPVDPDDTRMVGTNSATFQDSLLRVAATTALPFTIQTVKAHSNNGREFIGLEVVDGGDLDELL